MTRDPHERWRSYYADETAEMVTRRLLQGALDVLVGDDLGYVCLTPSGNFITVSKTIIHRVRSNSAWWGQIIGRFTRADAETKLRKAITEHWRKHLILIQHQTGNQNEREHEDGAGIPDTLG